MEVATQYIGFYSFLSFYCLVSTPFLPNGSRYLEARREFVLQLAGKFQHLFFLMEVATIETSVWIGYRQFEAMFQHLFFLMEVATTQSRKDWAATKELRRWAFQHLFFLMEVATLNSQS